MYLSRNVENSAFYAESQAKLDVLLKNQLKLC